MSQRRSSLVVYQIVRALLTAYLLNELWYKRDLGFEAKIQIVITVSGLWSAEPTGKKVKIKRDFGLDRNAISKEEKPTEDNGTTGRFSFKPTGDVEI